MAVTPFQFDGKLDLESVRTLACHVVKQGVGTLTVGGSVGEFMSLAPEERQAVLATTIEGVDGRVPVIAATGGDLTSAIDQGLAASAAGASAVMVHQPLNPSRSPGGWVSYHRHLAAALAPVPLVLYVRDPGIGMSEFRQLFEAALNVIAVKYALPDPPALATLSRAFGDRVVWLCGLGESWAPFAWLAGARGFTSGLANVSGEVPGAMVRAMRAGDMAAVVGAAERAITFERLRAQHGGAASVAVVKEALAMLDVIATSAVRPPLESLRGPDLSRLRSIVSAIAR